jgi:hypothetical protein
MNWRDIKRSGNKKMSHKAKVQIIRLRIKHIKTISYKKLHLHATS